MRLFSRMLIYYFIHSNNNDNKTKQKKKEVDHQALFILHIILIFLSSILTLKVELAPLKIFCFSRRVSLHDFPVRNKKLKIKKAQILQKRMILPIRF
jgi:hypothetical protein